MITALLATISLSTSATPFDNLAFGDALQTLTAKAFVKVSIPKGRNRKHSVERKGGLAIHSPLFSNLSLDSKKNLKNHPVYQKQS